MDSTTIPRSLELEITQGCQLSCSHCLTSSRPGLGHGDMTMDDWRRVIDEAAGLGVETIQLIGGEPLTNPGWQHLVAHTITQGMRVEVYSNLYAVQPSWWAVLDQPEVSLGTSWYSDLPAEHDEITGKPGSWTRTLNNIHEALRRGIRVRVGIVTVLPGQRVEQAEAMLREMGVKKINVDHARPVGRAAPEDYQTKPEDLCGGCGRGRAAILPNGQLAPCVLGRSMTTGDVREEGIRAILGSQRWRDTIDRIPQPSSQACGPDDSGDCDPASTTACDPAYG